jgi:hypothetical protein
MHSHSTLRLALRLNAGFSSLSAIVILFVHGWLSEWMGVPSSILLAAAGGLGAFAVYLVVTAARSDAAKLRAESLRHSISDFAWVVASIGVILSGILTSAGNWTLAAVAVPVLILGIAQWRALPGSEQDAIVVNA